MKGKQRLRRGRACRQTWLHHTGTGPSFCVCPPFTSNVPACTFDVSAQGEMLALSQWGHATQGPHLLPSPSFKRTVSAQGTCHMHCSHCHMRFPSVFSSPFSSHSLSVSTYCVLSLKDDGQSSKMLWLTQHLLCQTRVTCHTRVTSCPRDGTQCHCPISQVRKQYRGFSDPPPTCSE